MESATHYKNGKSKAKNPRKIKFNPGQLKMDIEESKAFAKFLRRRTELVESSQELYKSHVTTYCYFHQKKIDELIDEYKQDQKIGHEDYDEYKVYIDIMDYLNHCKANKQAKSTILGKFKRIKSFLKENNVEIPEEMRYNLNRYDDSAGYFTKQDLPNKQTMQTVINGANPKHKGIYAWVYTTGSGRSETANLTVTNFINGIKEFCNNQEDAKEMIKELDGNTIQEKIIDGEKVKIPVVPKIKMKRQKTSHPYYTITTPECVQIIIDYIKTDLSILDHYNAYEDDFDERGRLFGLQAGAIGNAFKETNLKYGFGKRGRYNFFGCHRLRHNHYTQIDNQNLANRLEGRKVTDKNDRSYDHNDDPDELREKYKDHMHKFEIFDRYNIIVNDEKITKLENELNDAILENKKLQDSNEELKKDNKRLQERVNNVEVKIDNVNNQLLSQLSPNESLPNTIRNEVIDYIRDNDSTLNINDSDYPLIVELTTTLALKHEKIYKNGTGIGELIKKAYFELKLDKTLKKSLEQNVKKDMELEKHIQDIFDYTLKYAEQNELLEYFDGKDPKAKLVGYLYDNKEQFVNAKINEKLAVEIIREVAYYDDVTYLY